MSEHNHDCHGSCSCHSHEHDDGCGCGCGCGHEHGGEHQKSEWIRLGIAFALLVFGVMASVFSQPYLPVIFYAASYMTAGFEVLVGAVRGIAKGDAFGENFLMSIASIGAFLIGEYAEACAVMLLFELGERFQDIAVEKSRSSIRTSIEMRPESITLLRDGKEINASPAAAHVGDVFVVKPGEKFACDGEIIDGDGDIDMKSLTGESLPVTKTVGDKVLSGSISIEGTFRVKVLAEYEDSTVAKILEMLEHAKSKKSHAENFIKRFARVYTPIVCMFAAMVAFLPPFFGLGDFETWIYRGLCALAVSCPCALVISVPLGFFSGLGAASREGILVKGANYLEMLSRVNVAVFDKTGTLTTGKFTFVGEENVTDADTFHFALAVCERYSTHPIALAITENFGHLANGVEISESTAIRGRGVRAAINGDVYFAGNAALMRENSIEYKEATLGSSSVYVAKNNVFLGSATFADKVKDDSAEVLCGLENLGVSHTVMLSGDKREIAEKVAASLGIKETYAELLPSDKAEIFEKIKSERVALYVGDGINDAPVLALADVGVAMGGIGSAAALEAADAVIMGDSLEKLPAAIRISHRTMKIVKQNIVFSLAVKLLIVLLAAIGYANLWMAVFGDVGVCLIAVLNSLRVMKK